MRWASISIPIISLIISVTSLFYSLRSESIEPKLAIQVSDYEAKRFRVLVHNYGVSPTFLSSFRLEISLLQIDTEHNVTAVFPLTEQVFLPAGESKTIDLEYASHSFAEWESRGGTDRFTLSFLYGAASLGSNLSCLANANFTVSNDFNERSLSPSIAHSVCSSAFEWFAKEIGPLKDNDLIGP